MDTQILKNKKILQPDAIKWLWLSLLYIYDDDDKTENNNDDHENYIFQNKI